MRLFTFLSITLIGDVGSLTSAVTPVGAVSLPNKLQNGFDDSMLFFVIQYLTFTPLNFLIGFKFHLFSNQLRNTIVLFKLLYKISGLFFIETKK